MDFIFRRIYKGAIKAVIFDLAGTVVDYGSCAPAGVFVELFRNHNIKISNNQARGPMGMHKKDHIRALLKMEAISTEWEKIHGKLWSEDDVESMYQEFIPLQIDCLPKYNRLIPGVLELAEKLRSQDIKIGVTTGYNNEMTDLVIEGMSKQGFKPDSVVCATDVAAGRPAPWMIFRSMEKLGVFPPESLISVGDTIPDIESGLNAGVWTVGVAKSGNMIGLSEDDVSSMPKAELEARLNEAYEIMYRSGAHYVIDSVADFENVLDSRFRGNDRLGIMSFPRKRESILTIN